MKPIYIAIFGLAAPLLVLVPLTLPTPAEASARDEALSGFLRCNAIADDRTWLDCVYGAAQPMRAQLGLPPAPASQQKLVPPAAPGAYTVPMSGMAMANPAPAAVAPAARSQPGYQPNFMDLMTGNYKPDPVTALTSYKFDKQGYFTVTLANGETWRQDSGDTKLAHWDKPARSYTAQVVLHTRGLSRLRVGTELFTVVRG